MKKTAKSEAKNGMRKTYVGTDQLGNKLTLTIDRAAGTVLLYGTTTRMPHCLTAICARTAMALGHSQAVRVLKARALASRDVFDVSQNFRFHNWVEA